MIIMKFLSNVINLYVIATLSAFAYLVYTKLNETDNYFAAFLHLTSTPMMNFLIYNVIISIITLLYKVFVFFFFEDIKQNERMTIQQKSMIKLFQFLFLSYWKNNDGMFYFASFSFVFLLFLFHTIANARSNYLIHTHVTQNMNLNYRLLAFYLCFIFIDFQIVSNTFTWLFRSSNDSSYIIFAYYMLSISLNIIESASTFFVHFYQIYTECPIENSDVLLVRLKFYVSVPILFLEIIFRFLLFYDQLMLAVFLLLMYSSSFNDALKTFRSYSSMNNLIEKMKKLKQLGPAQLDKQHDKVCTVCFHEITSTAVMLFCKHIFHKECLRQWIVKNSNNHCPKCKKSFDFENGGNNSFEEQIKQAQIRLRQRFAEQQRNDPLGFEKDVRNNQIPHYEAKKKSEDEMRMNSQGIDDEDNIQIIRVDGSNHLAKIESTKREAYMKKRDKYVGSVPFGLPTEAIYRRTSRDMAERNKIMFINQKMIKFMKMQPTKQLLFVPEFQ